MSELDYEVNIGEWLADGWNRFIADWKSLFSFAALYLLVAFLVALPIGFAAGLLGALLVPLFEDSIGPTAGISIGAYGVNVINLLISVPLGAFFMGGLAKGGLAVVRKQAITFNEMFAAGREYFLPVCCFMGLLSLISLAQLTIGTGADLGLQWYLMDTGQFDHAGMPPVWKNFAVLGVQIIMGLVLCFFTVTVVFSLFLIVDQRLGALAAMKRSITVFCRHYFMNLLYVFLVVLVSIAGVFACCVGVFFTTPLALAMLAVMYDRIFTVAPAGPVA